MTCDTCDMPSKLTNPQKAARLYSRGNVPCYTPAEDNSFAAYLHRCHGHYPELCPVHSTETQGANGKPSE